MNKPDVAFEKLRRDINRQIREKLGEQVHCEIQSLKVRPPVASVILLGDTEAENMHYEAASIVTVNAFLEIGARNIKLIQLSGRKAKGGVEWTETKKLVYPDEPMEVGNGKSAKKKQANLAIKVFKLLLKFFLNPKNEFATVVLTGLIGLFLGGGLSQNTEDTGLQVLIIGLFTVIPPLVFIIYFASERENNKQKEYELLQKSYDAAKERLATCPGDYQARTEMIEAGRKYYSYLREGQRPTIYDEQAIQNDLMAIIGTGKNDH